ncbi:receptor-like protein 12 [Carex littledalei]|uniref:Receptor-like protein 12 n=1 Tax=Carex littledalei TaxID=544730 RepID=A0A833VS57_9POAL|nr:receptor-like protein 12 [Carex littledalei]
MMALHLSLPLTLLIFFSFSTEFASLAQRQCLPGQRRALLQLKNGFSTSKLQSWNSTTDCCTWEGVTCDPATGHVTALELSNRSISGLIDPAFFNLSSLQNLSLAYNLFNNVTLPETGFERLSNLIHLNLSNSGFVGQIPTGISQLTNLVLLDLSTFDLNVGSSSLYFREPSIKTLLGNLTKLQVLYLDGVNISLNGSEWGLAVSQLGPTLRSLSMSGCSLMGPFDQSLSQLSQISYLRLDYNNLSSPVPEFFANFSYLSVLKLSSCLINGEFPVRILQLKNLKEIDLSDNPTLSGQLPEFEKYSSLQTLILSATNFSGQIPDSIGNLQNLSTFLIYDCNFHGEITTNLQKLVRLSYLDISRNRFTGEIPKFHNWLRISEYVLNNNNFAGSIPDSSSYAGLDYLSEIDFSYNSLSGTIPVSLFSLPSLQILLLSQNQLSGNLPEFSKGLPALQTIDISSNNLQGPLPSSIFKLSQLQVLNLASNNFTGMLDLDSLWYLKNLASIDLSNNMLSVTDGAIGNKSWYTSFPNIKILNLVSCNLTKFPSFMRYQSGISILDLSNNKIGGTIPNWVQKIGNESYLTFNLSHNLFTGLEADTLFLSLDTLAILDLHSNMLNGTVPLPPPGIIVFALSHNIFSLLPPNLTSYLGFTIYLSLSNNKLTGSIPGSICNASYLQVLDLSYNNFMGELPHCLLENTSTLAVLNVKNNKLTGSFPQAISEDCGFRTINLNGNNINGTLPQSLMNCASLEVLDLGNNKIDGGFPYWLGELKDLKILVLRSNKFYGPVSKPRSQSGTNDSAAFSMLQILDLSSNSFNGTLPKEFFRILDSMMVNSKISTSLTVDFDILYGSYYQNSVTVTFKGLEVTLVSSLAIFTSLDFSGNGFGGKIPQEIGELKMLDLLNMSHNTLTGTIPPQIGDLKQLESLDLSSNELTGNIPEELTLLTFLSSLNLSHNNLVGKVPQDNQFSTFSNNSYLYNTGLCGYPLTAQCGAPLSEIPVWGTKFSNNLNWQFIFTELGFVVGFVGVLGPLMVWSEWREQFNKCVDCLL